MPYSKIIPVTQVKSWNREGIPPTVTPIRVIFEQQFSLINFITFTINYENTLVEWLNAPYNEYGYLNQEDDLQLFLQNTNDLANGNYRATVIVTAVYEDLSEITLSSEVNLVLSGIVPNQITTDKSNYSVVYNRADNTLSGETDVEILNNTGSADIEFSTFGTLFKEGIYTDGFSLEEDPAFPFSTNTELPEAGIQIVNCRLKKDGVYIYNFTVTVAVIGDNEIIADPESLQFKLRKGENETQTKSIQLINPLNVPFTITGPSWLNFSATSGSSTMSIDVTTINSEAIDAGTYHGDIEIHFSGKTISVQVTLVVISFVTVADKNFCLDGIILTANRQNDDARIVRITMTSSFKTNEKESEIVAVYDIMYQNSTAKTDIGKKVHQMFPRQRNSLFLNPKTKPFDNQFVYKPAKVSLKIEELDIAYVVKKTITLPDLFLYPGKKPKLFPLFTNHSARSRMNGIAYIFSYLANDIQPADIVGTAVASNPAVAGDVHTVKIEDADGLITWADKKNILGVTYLEFPQRDIIQVEWLNQNLVLEWAAFRGEYSLNNDYTQIYQENAFTFNNEKFEVKKVQQLKMNTGFILKSEADLIDEIIISKLCFIKIKDKNYRGFMTTQKLVAEDSTLELYQYDVEFLITEDNGY